MSMIRVVTYKASIQQDGSIYNESVEMSSEIDTMPLSQDQLAVAMDRVTEMRSAILSRRKAWEGATVPEAPKEQPKQSAPSQPGLATEKQISYIVELAGKTDNRDKLLKTFLAKHNISHLNQLSQKQVDELIMRLRNEV